MTPRLRPLTERIVARLPGHRALWIALWALVPWLNAGANLLLEEEARSAVWEQGDLLVVLNYAAVSLGVLVSVWGAERIARRLDALRTTTLRLEGDARERFGALNGVAGPLAAAAVTAVAFAAATVVSDGWTAALLRGATWFVFGVAWWTFLWTYASTQLALYRLGREPLVADAGRGDPALGLRPFGDVAFMGLWMLLAWVVPVLLTGLPDALGIGLGVLVLTGGLATFFLSLLGLHRQMAAVKESELAIARGLYAQAYEPVRRAPTLETLEQQQRLLTAADALEKRAHAIHEWPIDEGTLARLLTITTSVVAVIIARLILDPFGL